MSTASSSRRPMWAKHAASLSRRGRDPAFGPAALDTANDSGYAETEEDTLREAISPPPVNIVSTTPTPPRSMDSFGPEDKGYVGPPRAFTQGDEAPPPVIAITSATPTPPRSMNSFEPDDGGYVEVPDLPSLGPTPPPSPPTPLVIAVAREASRRGRHAPTVSIPLDVDSSPSAYTPGGSERLSFPPPPLPPKGRSQPDGNNGFSTQSNPPQYAQPMPPPLAARVNQDSQPADKNVSYAQPRPSQYPQPRVRVNLDDDDDGFYAAPRAAPSLTRRASQTRRMSTFMQKRELHLPARVPQFNTRPLALNKARPPPTVNEDAPIPLGKRSDWTRADTSRRL
ncbi:hypothetical protein HWV62_32961 [Athelia sp. TMB]|nr:hypothetical protein HWV62_32961 [Athelia sp. TMB]